MGSCGGTAPLAQARGGGDKPLQPSHSPEVGTAHHQLGESMNRHRLQPQTLQVLPGFAAKEGSSTKHHPLPSLPCGFSLQSKAQQPGTDYRPCPLPPSPWKHMQAIYQHNHYQGDNSLYAPREETASIQTESSPPAPPCPREIVSLHKLPSGPLAYK